MYCFFFYIIPPLTTSTFFFFNDTATTEIYTLSLHDALPIYMVEPVKDYTREALAPSEPTSFTPMNRVVDAVPLESDAARHFGELVDKFLAASCHDGATEGRLRTQLTAWRDNDAKLQPLMERSFLAKEVAASSRDLSALGAMGLAALDLLAKGGTAPGDWKTGQLATLEETKKPKAQLLLIPANAVEKLVESTGNGCNVPK